MAEKIDNTIIKSNLIFIGAIPPPYHGQNVSFKRFLDSEINQEFNVIHLNTSIDREISEISKIKLKYILFFLKTYLKLFVLCIKFKPKGVYFSISQNNTAIIKDFPYLIISKILVRNIKIVAHLRGSNFKSNFENASYFFKKFILFNMKLINDYIVLGESLRGEFLDWVDNKNIHVCPNGTAINPNISNKTWNYDKPLRVFYLSSIIESKGILDVLSALKRLNDSGIVIKLKIAGDFGINDPISLLSLEELKKEFFLKTTLLSNHCDYLGILNGKEKVEQLLNSDILILPTYYTYEGLPNAILEGMAAGNCIIATNHAAISEVVINGSNGFLVEKKSPVKIADTILKLHHNRHELIRMGKKSRMLYEDKFNSIAMNKLLIDTVKSIYKN